MSLFAHNCYDQYAIISLIVWLLLGTIKIVTDLKFYLNYFIGPISSWFWFQFTSKIFSDQLKIGRVRESGMVIISAYHFRGTQFKSHPMQLFILILDRTLQTPSVSCKVAVPTTEIHIKIYSYPCPSPEFPNHGSVDH